MFRLFILPHYLDILPSFHLSKHGFSSSCPRPLNCYRSSIGKVGRKIYTRMYPTTLVYNNGASINIRYHEPRQIIKMPLDVTTLTEEQKQRRLERRTLKSRIVIQEEIDDDFSLDEYQHLWKK